ncbi:MAG: hypothetical protein ACYTGG_08025 [Planctomycetota bacterium]|jgi:hypothetical protein
MIRFRSLLRTVVAIAALLAVAQVTLAYPKPAPVPYRWELNFKAGDLRLYLDESTGDYYWYFVYEVTNRTGRDQLWAPSFVLFTDAGQILRSGDDVPARVTRELLELLGNPLLQEQTAVIGTIRQGRENLIEGLAVWPARRLDVNEQSLFIAGISGETARVQNPATGEDVILRKTLQRDYLIPGEAVGRSSRPVEVAGERWIMR